MCEGNGDCSNIDVNQVNIADYTKSLDKLVTMAEKEYYVHLVDINRHQVTVAKTLLWLSIVFIGFNIAILEWAYAIASSAKEILPILTPCYFFIATSILASVVGFAFAVFSIPAFGGYRPLYCNSWADYPNKVTDNMEKPDAYIYLNILNELLTNLDKACDDGNATNGRRGLALRVSSILLIVSAILSLLGFIFFSFNYYL